MTADGVTRPTNQEWLRAAGAAYETQGGKSISHLAPLIAAERADAARPLLASIAVIERRLRADGYADEDRVRIALLHVDAVNSGKADAEHLIRTERAEAARRVVEAVEDVDNFSSDPATSELKERIVRAARAAAEETP